jgi:DNA-binding IclR family transcriptional regulator
VIHIKNSGKDKNHTPRIQSLHRALDILEAMSDQDEVGVTELSKKIGLPKGTTHRLMLTFSDRGYVQQSPETTKYRYGYKLLELGGIAFNKLDLRKVALPVLQALVAKTNEIAHLVVLDKDEAVYIEKIEGNGTLRLFSQIGRRSPLHCTGVGKALMAFLPEQEVDSIVQKRGLTRFTPNTITDVQVLKNELQKIRKLGFSLDNEEHEAGVWCAATPIWDYSGKAVAAISTTAPQLRVNEERKSWLIAVTTEAGKELSKRLGAPESIPGLLCEPINSFQSHKKPG